MIKKIMQLAFSRPFLFMLFSTGLPVTIQVLLQSSRSIADIIMLGQLGEAPLAAMGGSARIIFMIMMALFGLVNGGAILIAQYWGAKKVAQTRQSTAHILVLALPIAAIFSLLCYLFAWQIMSFTIKDDLEVVALGVEYLNYALPSMIFIVVSMTFTSSLRCVGQSFVGMIFTIIGIVSNIILNYLFIFGFGDVEPMGVAGAALATTISAAIEMILVLTYIYATKHFLSISFKDLKEGFESKLYKRILKIGAPLSINSLIWSFGIFMYVVLVGQEGRQELAVLTMVTPIESLLMAFYIGVSTTASVSVGNALGANKFEDAWRYSHAFILWSIIMAFFVSILIFFAREYAFIFVQGVSDQTIKMAKDVLLMLAIVGGFRAVNITIIVGILRAGGDQKFVLAMDVFCQWAVGILITFICIKYWDLSMFWIFLAINTEEIVKLFICMWRLLSKKWVVNLVNDEPTTTIEIDTHLVKKPI
ncbi:MATE family efflux transporter [Marinicellulosiphila megalodicopiae]|uniref:MATE family efflux transporter n=1 Tax=Marinicellulosiphila megalodicopiae TaxID=2724896 RepID=UPI003BAE236D